MNIQKVQMNNYNNNKNNAPAFKGGIGDFFAKTYGKRMANSEKIRDFAEKASKKSIGDVSTHFQVLGSFITSSAYMISTLTNKDFDKDNAVTLTVNHGLNFAIPTFGAYVADKCIMDTKKQIEYKYAALQQSKLASKKLPKEKMANEMGLLGKRLGGVRVLIGIMTTTLIYRYITPVLVTPVANRIGEFINNSLKKNKNENAKIVEMNNPQTQTVDMKQYKKTA